MAGTELISVRFFNIESLRGHRQDTICAVSEMLGLELSHEGFDSLLKGEAMPRVDPRWNLAGTVDPLASLDFGGVSQQQVVNRLREEIRLAAATATPPPSNEAVSHTPPVSWQPYLGAGEPGISAGGLLRPVARGVDCGHSCLRKQRHHHPPAGLRQPAPGARGTAAAGAVGFCRG